MKITVSSIENQTRAAFYLGKIEQTFESSARLVCTAGRRQRGSVSVGKFPTHQKQTPAPFPGILMAEFKHRTVPLPTPRFYSLRQIRYLHHKFPPIKQMHRTAWTKQGSSLPSDRIKSVHAVKGPSNTPKKTKQQQSQETAKSQAVRKLEALLQAVKSASGLEKNPKGGCFCLGTR